MDHLEADWLLANFLLQDLTLDASLLIAQPCITRNS